MQKFGGIWTNKKLEALEAYLAFYTAALKNQPFKLHYVDAFAGAGSHVPVESVEQGVLIAQDALDGSVKRALRVQPGFDEYHFNDLDSEHIRLLETVRGEFPGRKISITQLDANAFVPQLCSSLGRNDRAVVFLDPFSTELDWATIESVAACQRADLWLLFPLSVILRMTPNDGDRVMPQWQRTLNRLLGTDEWEDALYRSTDLPQEDLFSGALPAVEERVNWKEVNQWVKKRLQQRFAYVEEPLVLRNNNRPLFSLFFAVANPNQKAWGLAKKASSHIVNKLNLQV